MSKHQTEDIPQLTREQKLQVYEEVRQELESKKRSVDQVDTNETEEPTKKKMRTDENQQNLVAHNILEMGHIYFFYRPRIGIETVNGIPDVQRFFFILKPTDEQANHKLIVVGRKMLPPIQHRSNTRSNAFWAILDIVTKDLKTITKELPAQSYETVTKGERTVDEARPVGEGLYALVRKSDGSCALAYVLELPHELSEVQKAFNIQKEAVYNISLKNPNPEAFASVAEQKHSASYSTGTPNAVVQNNSNIRLPEDMQKEFAGVNGERRFIPLKNMEFLEQEQMEMLLVGASDNLQHNLGDTGLVIEEEAEKEMQDGEFENPQQLLDELKLKKNAFPVAPLLGEWK